MHNCTSLIIYIYEHRNLLILLLNFYPHDFTSGTNLILYLTTPITFQWTESTIIM